MITWRCLFKLDKVELYAIVNEIKSGNSYTVDGWEDVYPTDNDILNYALATGVCSQDTYNLANENDNYCYHNI